MSNRTITIKIPISENNNSSRNVSNSVETIIKKINKIKQSVLSLRDANIENEQIRDQYIIHFQQCTEDREILNKIYKNLKFKFEHQNEDEQAKVEEIQRQEDQAPLPVSQTKTIPTLEFITREALIHKMAENQQIKVIRIRYEISVSTSIYNVQFSPDGNLIAFSDSSHVYIIQTKDGEILNKIDISPNECSLPDNLLQSDDFLTAGHCIRFSPDGKFLAVTNGPYVLLYSLQLDVHTPPLLTHTFPRHSGDVTSLVFNNTGSWLVTGSNVQIYVWDMSTYESVFNFNHDIPDSTIVSISTPPDTSMYVIGFSNGTLGMYNESFDSPMVSFNVNVNDTFLLDTEVSPFYTGTIVTCSSDCTAKVWEMRGIASHKFTLNDHKDAVTSAAFAPLKEVPILFTASGSKDKKIRAYQHKTGELLYSMEIHTDAISQIVSHPTQTMLASCGRDGLVCLWDYEVA